MPAAVKLREDYSAEELRALARRSKDVNQSRRLLSLAAVRDGMDRGGAAKIGGMDRQTLRDWVHRFNAAGPEGVIDNWTAGPKPRLSVEQQAQFAQIVEAGPDREKDGVVRWRGSISSVSSPRGLASTFILAMSESSSGNSAFRTSARGPGIRLRTSERPRLGPRRSAAMTFGISHQNAQRSWLGGARLKEKRVDPSSIGLAVMATSRERESRAPASTRC